MNRVILRFYVVKDKDVFEIIFDTRLSFEENFKLLKDIYRDFTNFIVFDPDRRMALKKTIPLAHFNFINFMTLYLF